MEGRRDCPQLHDSIGISRHMQSDSCGSRTRDFSHRVRPCVFLSFFYSSFSPHFPIFFFSCLFFFTICYCCHTIACIAIASLSYIIELPVNTSTYLLTFQMISLFICSFGFHSFSLFFFFFFVGRE